MTYAHTYAVDMGMGWFKLSPFIVTAPVQLSSVRPYFFSFLDKFPLSSFRTLAAFVIFPSFSRRVCCRRDFSKRLASSLKDRGAVVTLFEIILSNLEPD